MNFSSDPIHNLENLISKNTTKSISIYLLVIISLIGILACLPIIKVDISNQSRGVVRAKDDNNPISSVVSGKLIQVNLKNNQLVSKGDTLLVVAQDNLNAQKALNDTLYNTSNLLLKDINLLLKGKTNVLKTSTALEDYYKFKAQKNELQRTITQAQTNYNRYKILFDKQVVAKVEYETYVFELKAAQQALTSFIRQQKTQWENQKRDLEDRLTNLESAIESIQIEGKNYILTAPISGTLENVMGLQVGSFVNASQVIGSISPNTNLIVENTVTPTDIGLLKIGQEVKFQLDAFNYNQWGMLNGKVIEIDKNITIQDNTAFFKVRCSLNTMHLQLKNGYTTNISKGMTLTSRYFITRRSLYELLFDKVDDWFNPKTLDYLAL
ncbi:HlyD family efflux transporter periplasmic adaptor subunit [Winogradskyella sp. PAMC22761]|nr:HlyD family efflux transporter periplasmic adaptor subunit [Winogradskyella sp. PAMC22761]